MRSRCEFHWSLTAEVQIWLELNFDSATFYPIHGGDWWEFVGFLRFLGLVGLVRGWKMYQD